ncbi:hypothetical protein O9929_02765 [Vibrio lentus]|nr:hypothetical protein [Vibrio lentus]
MLRVTQRIAEMINGVSNVACSRTKWVMFCAKRSSFCYAFTHTQHHKVMQMLGVFSGYDCYRNSSNHPDVW